MLFGRRFVGMAILFFHLWVSVPIASSFPVLQHKELRTKDVRVTRKHRGHEMPLRGTRRGDDRAIIQTEDFPLSPASTSIQLLFGNPKMAIPNGGEPFNSKDRAQDQLLLKRLDGIDLYGREIIHAPSDANTATMSSMLVHTEQDVSSLDETTIWDATLLLEPDTSTTHPTSSTSGVRDDALRLIPQRQHTSCFVAMNRFHVKEDCKFLFEERWAQRQSKLPHQPGFVSFSLLRKRKAGGNEEYDRFNYSTCTIWDCIDSWKEWRNGEGRSSHDTSRQMAEVTKRVPVSEWLQGPSSPIFWKARFSVG